MLKERATVMRPNTTPFPEVWMRLHDRKRLAKIMAIQGVSARKLAEEVGYKSHAYITRLLRGEITNLTPERATRVALYLGVGIDDLFMPEGSSGARHSDNRNVA